MKGDFSRLTFDVTKHFRRVLMQQGRVQLDADWNEQTAILLHYLQTLAKDWIGEHGGPKDNLGFAIDKIDTISDDFKIGYGHYYVDGILAEQENKSIPISKAEGNSNNTIKVSALTINDVLLKQGQYLELFESNKSTNTQVVKISDINQEKLEITVGSSINSKFDMARRAPTYQTQNDYPLLESDKLDKKTYLAYLDLWERHITYIEDDYIREVALGGSDTATRSRLVWQVKITDKYWTEKNSENSLPVFKNEKDWRDWVDSIWLQLLGHWQPENRGLLKARAKQDPKKDTDPCITSPESRYRGTENQLYRIEIHQGGELTKIQDSSVKAPTFKWSRDNGSVVTIASLDGTELTVTNSRGLSAGDWLELTNDNQELRGNSGGILVKIKKVDCELITLEISISKPSDVPNDEIWPTKARLWNSDAQLIKESNSDEKDWIPLEYGIEIQFQLLTDGLNQYRIGDYWLIPARVATGDVEWPGDAGRPESLPPYGVEHHYAPIAIIDNTTAGAAGGINRLADLRKQFESQAKYV